MPFGDRLTKLPFHQHLPRRTMRMRLTALYGALFVLSGAGLLAITYFLVLHATSGLIFKGQDGSVAVIGTPRVGILHLWRGSSSCSRERG